MRATIEDMDAILAIDRDGRDVPEAAMPALSGMVNSVFTKIGVIIDNTVK